MESWKLYVIFCFSGCWFSGLRSRIPEFFKCPKIRCNFNLRGLLDLGSTSLEQNLKLKTLSYLLFIPIFYLLFGCPVANFWLLSGNSLTNLMLITTFGLLFIIQPKLQKIPSPDVRPVFPKCGNAPNTQNSCSLTLW